MTSLNFKFLVLYLFLPRLIGRKIASHHFLPFFGLIGEYQVYQEYWRIPILPRIPRIYHEYQEYTWNHFIIGFWFLVVLCGIKGVKSSLRFISNLFCLLGEKSLRTISYLFLVQDIIKVHFCQLRLVVSFNNILYT